MNDTRFTNDHEWLSMESDDVGVVGITDYAQQELGDLVYIELPEVGDEVVAGEKAAVIDSVKAAADVNSPVSGEVLEVNEDLADSPELVNESPMENGWLYKLKVASPEELDSLMTQDDYEKLVEDLSRG